MAADVNALLPISHIESTGGEELACGLHHMATEDVMEREKLIFIDKGVASNALS